MTPTALTTTNRALTTADVMTAFGAFLGLYVADGDASPETIRSYYGNAAQFVAWCGEHGINPATVIEDDIATCRRESVAPVRFWASAPLGDNRQSSY
jgi:integrase/recombinase XerD